MKLFRFTTCIFFVLLLDACTISNKNKGNQPHPTPSGGGQAPADSRGRGGIIDGNGGELIVEEQNPWYVNAKSVSYCIDKSADFSASSETASNTIRNVFAAWKNVLKQLDATPQGGDFLIGGGQEPLVMAMDFAEVKCSEKPSFTFKLGVFDSEVNDALRFSANQTLGFALRTHYDSASGQSIGYIWLAPDKGEKRYEGPALRPTFWSEQSTLHNVLFHEIGHTFGFVHIENTIMDATVPARIVAQGLNTMWRGADLLNTHMASPHKAYCGALLGDEVNDAITKTLWNLEAKGLEFCLAKLPISGDTEVLSLTIKRDGKALASERISSDGSWGESLYVGGSYLRRLKSKDYTLQKVRFFYLDKTYLTNARYERDGASRLIELNMIQPGFLNLTFPLENEWKTLTIVAASDQDDLIEFLKLPSQ